MTGRRCIPARGVLIALPLVLIAAAGSGNRPARDHVETRELVLVDETGRMRLRMAGGGEQEPPGLALFDEAGTKRAGLSMGPRGPGMALYDRDGRVRLVLEVAGEAARVALHGADGRERISLALEGENPVLGLFDSVGIRRVALGLDRGSPALGLMDSRGNQRVGVSVIQSGAVATLQDEHGRPRLSAFGGGKRSGLVIYNADGSAVATLPSGSSSTEEP